MRCQVLYYFRCDKRSISRGRGCFTRTDWNEKLCQPLLQCLIFTNCVSLDRARTSSTCWRTSSGIRVGGICVRLTLVETLTIALKSLEQYGYQRVELSSDVQILEIRHCSEKVLCCSKVFHSIPVS